ncbi:hypothetical protein [Chelativorans sp. M5D2P16]|uniref:hypothetical protein n=1 Tax=Chelativorans sp. M5D2P16 TaxID=3095678 RepID=UPI002ACA7F15|nr:hypothetical protein [Chelativorans sp. M5D2P16]MDZ5697352.1 hypothetical protein [Chelativorans sp. M5D2P16]
MKPGPPRPPADTTPQAPTPVQFLTLFPSIMLPMFLAVVDQTIVAAALPAIAGRTDSRTGHTAVFPSCGLVVVVLMLGSLAIFAPRLSEEEISWVLGFTAIFMGTVMGVVQVTVQTAAGAARLGTAAATVQFSRSLGAALGTAIVGTVLFAALASTDAEAARLFGSILQKGPEVLGSLPAPRRAIVQEEIADAFRLRSSPSRALRSRPCCWPGPCPCGGCDRSLGRPAL